MIVDRRVLLASGWLSALAVIASAATQPRPILVRTPNYFVAAILAMTAKLH